MAPHIRTARNLSATDTSWMRRALRLARKGAGSTSPNPMVGAVLVKDGRTIGQGWHRRTGEPHAEIEALRDAQLRGQNPKGATLYVTLEPCSTHGRTPPCTEAVLAAGIRRVVAGATDPNPRHQGRGLKLLSRAGLAVEHGVLEQACSDLNEAFNHWIVHRTPLVTVKAAMTLDGKIATSGGESKWITGPQARQWAMKLRGVSDSILVGINTILADDPSLTFRSSKSAASTRDVLIGGQHPRRLVLDALARTPLSAKIVNDGLAPTTIVVGPTAPKSRIAALARRVEVLRAPAAAGQINLRWLLRKIGGQNVTSLLVEGGGEVNASFLLQRHAQKIAFFYAPIVLGGRLSRPGVAGAGAHILAETLSPHSLRWRKLGPDLLLEAQL